MILRLIAPFHTVIYPLRGSEKVCIVVKSKMIALAVCVSSVATHASAGSYTYTTIDVAGGSGTILTAINDDGTVTGYYFDAMNHSHGFVWKAGVFTFIVSPLGADNSQPVGIDNRGTLVANFLPNKMNNRVLKRKEDGTEQKVRIDAPSPSQQFSTGLSNDAIIGYYMATVAGAYQTTGFLFKQGRTISLTPPNSAGVFPSGINDNDQVVGNATSTITGGDVAFVYDNGRYSDISVPGAARTSVVSITHSGHAYGTFQNELFSFFRSGFILDGKNYREYSFPGSSATEVVNALSVDNFVGQWQSLDFSKTYAFHYLKGYYYPILPPAAADGTVIARAINNKNSIVGIYYLSPTAYHPYGFLAVCPVAQAPCNQ